MKHRKKYPAGCPPPSTLNPAKRLFPWLVIVTAGIFFAGPSVSSLVAELKWSDLPRHISSQDKNGNGVSDTDDIIEGAVWKPGESLSIKAPTTSAAIPRRPKASAPMSSGAPSNTPAMI